VIPDKDQFKKILSQSLIKEWEMRLPEMSNSEVVSIYFGGGTPSLFGPVSISSILNMVKKDVKISENVEITLEANPENITYSLMKDYADSGINRVSIGIQTLDPEILKKLERQHTSKKALDAVLITKDASIDNITIDLMYDLPGQTLSIWENTLVNVSKLPINHLSLYNLTIEPHTTFFKNQSEIIKTIPEPDVSLKMYEMAQDILEANDLKQYEISAFAKENFQSIHNTGYWKARPFLGFGPSAFSYWKGKRFRNIPNINRYSMQLKENTFPIDFEEKLDIDAHIRELLTIRIRLKEGVDLKSFETTHGKLDPETYKQIINLCAQGYIEESHGVYSLTKKGVLFYDTVAVELI
jgi:oxygen-independent coproporphyrinogen-3 oxidase